MKKLIVLVVLIAVGWGLYYAISPIFDVQEVRDEAPEALAPTVTSGFEKLSPPEQEEMTKQMEVANEEPREEMNEDMPNAAAKTTKPVIETVSVFPVKGTTGHPASGNVRVIETASGSVVRFENFETINGPRLHLYLSKDLEGNDFIDLGPIRGTKGDINYTVPEGVDLSEYRYVMHWCVPFGVLFNYADVAG